MIHAIVTKYALPKKQGAKFTQWAVCPICLKKTSGEWSENAELVPMEVCPHFAGFFLAMLSGVPMAAYRNTTTTTN